MQHTARNDQLCNENHPSKDWRSHISFPNSNSSASAANATSLRRRSSLAGLRDHISDTFSLPFDKLELVDFVPLKYEKRWNKHLANHPDALFRQTILLMLFSMGGIMGPDPNFSWARIFASNTKSSSCYLYPVAFLKKNMDYGAKWPQ